MKYTEDCKDVPATILPFKTRMQPIDDGFSLAQLRSRELLVECSTLQELMENNSQNRLQAQQQLTKRYHLLARHDTVHEQSCKDTLSIACLKQKISELEVERISLHKQFIAKQVQFRQTISDQRRQLVETVNRTRARTPAVRTCLSLVSNTTSNSSESNSSDDSNESFNIDEFVQGLMKQA